MNRIILFFSLLFFLFSCREKEENNLFWEKTFGNGTAFSIKAAPDSGFISCGQINNAPYIIKLDRAGRKVFDYTSENKGLYGSVLFDSTGYFLGGNSSGNMLLTRLNPEGEKVWEKTVNSTFQIFRTILLKTIDGTFLGIGTANADSALNMSSGLMFVWFDSTGTITKQQNINQGVFISANDAATDNSGNIYLAVTRKETGSQSKASVVKWSGNLQKYWETELYSNPIYGAASLGIEIDKDDEIFVSGYTELPSDGKLVLNSFIVSLDNKGTVKWKKYLESSNSGIEVLLDKNSNLMMLNRNCLLIDIISSDDGSNIDKIRTIDACDSYNTDAFGWDIEINPEDNIILSGSKGNNFYIAVKHAGDN